jgi:alkanesulfonate monooxygenase
MNRLDATIRVFSTCPQSRGVNRESYVQHVMDVARWSEEAGCHGILVYADNGLVDPWLVSQIILQNTRCLSPLVALQPIYMHPYTAAKMVASLGHLHDRRIWLNMVAGGFTNDLLALDDATPHDQRYERLIEYTLIMKTLLSSTKPVTFKGKHYRVTNATMKPALPAELFPEFMISGSSEAGLAAAKATGAVAVKYPRPAGEEDGDGGEYSAGAGVRLGIIARDDSQEAWRTAHLRFPETRGGQLPHQLTMKTSDSHWHKQLSPLGASALSADNPYWLEPFQNSSTFCPYLVGSYAQIALELSRYMMRGFGTFILDIPPSRDELHHIGVVFAMAAAVRS